MLAHVMFLIQDSFQKILPLLCCAAVYGPFGMGG